MFFAGLPLADQVGSDVQMGGKDSLSGVLTGSQSASLLGSPLALMDCDGREAERVELA
jgi:hypothetical protein